MLSGHLKKTQHIGSNVAQMTFYALHVTCVRSLVVLLNFVLKTFLPLIQFGDIIFLTFLVMLEPGLFL